MTQSVECPTSIQVMIPVCGFESHFRLCADSSEAEACFRFCVSLSLWPPPHSLFLSLSQKQTLKKIFKKQTKNEIGSLEVDNSQGTWVAQLVKDLTLDFGSGNDPMVCGFEPSIGLCAHYGESAWDSLSPSLSASLFLSKINK